MMPEKMKLEVKLTRQAKGIGGDRYEFDIPSERKPQVLYFHQSISRPNSDTPVGRLWITVDYEKPKEE